MTIEKTIECAVASVEMEGYHIDNDCIQLCKNLLENKINIEQYIAIIKQQAGVQA